MEETNIGIINARGKMNNNTKFTETLAHDAEAIGFMPCYQDILLNNRSVEMVKSEGGKGIHRSRGPWTHPSWSMFLLALQKPYVAHRPCRPRFSGRRERRSE